MRAEIYLKRVRGNEILKKLIERKIIKINKILDTFGSDLKNLRIILEKNNKKRIYTSHITLSLPTKTFNINKMGYSAIEAVSKSFRTLHQKLVAHKEKLKHEDEYKRERTPSRKLPLIQYYSEDEKVELEVSKHKRKLLEKISNKLNKFIFYINDYLLILEEDYKKSLIDQIQPEEIIDAAILDALDECTIKDDLVSLENKIYKHITQRVQQKIDELMNNNKIPLEARVRNEDIDEDLYEYYQPDVYWHVEDIFEDPNEILPEEIIEDDELMQNLKKVMKDIPIKLRQIFYLYYIQGYNVDDLKIILNKSSEETQKLLNELNEYLKKKVNQNVLQKIIH